MNFGAFTVIEREVKVTFSSGETHVLRTKSSFDEIKRYYGSNRKIIKIENL